MNSQALQELVKKIFGNEQTKQQFISNPDSVLSQFPLSEQEKKAVLSTYAKLGLASADSQQLDAALNPTWVWS